MKYLLAVLLGAICYGILSTIVVTAYGEGYGLGEVVGSQLFVGFVLTWGLVLFTKIREKSIVLLFQFTWIGVLIHSVSQRKRPNGIVFLTLVILFGGTLLAAGIVEQGLARMNWIGVILGLLSAVSYSLFILLSGKVVPSVHPAYRSGWMITGGMLLAFALFPPQFLFNGMLWGDLMAYGLLLGFFGAFIPPVLFAVGVPHIGEGMTSIIGASELPVAVMLSSIVLHEHVSMLQWMGVVLVMFGVALPEMFKRIRRSSASSAYAIKNVST